MNNIVIVSMMIMIIIVIMLMNINNYQSPTEFCANKFPPLTTIPHCIRSKRAIYSIPRDTIISIDKYNQRCKGKEKLTKRAEGRPEPRGRSPD